MAIADALQIISVPAVVIAWTSVSVACAYVIATAVYRLHFHPLAKYPGPFWARLTSIPSYWHTLRQDRHIWLLRLQEQYGSTFRYRPDAVLINTPDAFRAIFSPTSNIGKSVFYQVWPRTVDALTTWNSTHPEVHGRKRRVLNNAFSDKALRSIEPFIRANADRWVELIGQEVDTGGARSRPLNAADWINYLVFDILGDLCFGKSFNMKEPESDMRYVPHLMVDFLKLVHPIAFSPFADFWVWLKPRGLDWLVAKASPPALKNWEEFVEKCMADRTRMEEQNTEIGRKDFFHYLFRAVDPETGKGWDLEELYGECESLIIAGSDTTSIILSAMFFYLARKPDVQAKLAAEITSAFSTAEEIQGGPKLNDCKYLHAFVQEGLRMTPPVSAEPSRVVLAGGAIVEGQYFPEGVRVSTGLYCLSYNEEVYPEPFSFIPERWIVGEKGTTRESVELAERGLCTFSAGARGCPGKALAWLEMTIIMAKIIHTFEVKPDPTNNLGGGGPDSREGRRRTEQYQTYDAFVSLRDGPMVQFEKRAAK